MYPVYNTVLPDMIAGIVILIVLGLIHARSSLILKTIGSMLLRTFIEVAGAILVIMGVDGALKENE